MLEGLSVNYSAIILSAIISLIIGAVWFSSLGFGRQWKKSMGFKKSDMKKMSVSANQAYSWGLASALLSMFILAVFMQYTQVSSASNGASVAFLIWLGFVFPVMLGNVLWENKSWKAFFISTAYQLVSLMVAGTILGAWI